MYVCKNNSIVISCNQNDGWILKKNDIAISIDKNNPDNLVFCLPILEEDFTIFYNKIDAYNCGTVFPWFELLKTALSSNSIYWITLGTKWLKEYKLIFDISPLEFDIEAIIENKKINQGIRHELRKVFPR